MKCYYRDQEALPKEINGLCDLLLKRLCVFLIFIVILGSWNLEASAQNVNFPDANLAAAIRDELGLVADEDITQTDLAGLQFLFASSRRIRDLTGLEDATNLTDLSLDFNQIEDIEPLRNLPKLTNLYLTFNRIENIEPLSSLTTLKAIELWNNPISDFFPLSRLINLENLSLINTGFSDSDIPDLSPLINLTALDLSLNNISETSSLAGVLSGMTGLDSLRLASNQISDVSPFGGLTGLTKLMELILSSSVSSFY